MKKIIVPVLIVLLALAVLAGVLIYLFGAASRLPRQDTPEQLTPQAYLAASWPDYGFTAYDADTGVLELTYAVSATYEQVRKYGKDAGYADLAEGHIDTAALIAYGCEHSCGFTPREVVVTGMSSDGQAVYRSSTRDGVTGCWESD